MQGVSPSSRIENARKLLSNLQEQISLLPPDCQTIIYADLEHIAETMSRFAPEKRIAEQYAFLVSAESSLEPGLSEQLAAEKGPEFRMGMVLRKAHAGWFVRDLVNKTVKWSPELYDLLGLDPATPNRSEIFMNMIHPDDRERAERDTRTAIERGGSFYQEFRILRSNGEIIWLSSIGYVEHDASGCPLTLTGVNQDISLRKAAELAQEQAHAEAILEKQRLMAVMEAMPVGVAILNLKGEVLQANRGFTEIWGGPLPQTLSVEEFSIYKAWWIESEKPVRAGEWAAARAIRKGETVVNQFLKIERFDGSHRFVLNSAAPILDEQHQQQGCVVTIRDITEWIQAERALQKSEQSLRESEERLRVVLSSLPITAYMLDRDLRYTWVYSPQHGMTAESMLGKRDDEIYPGVSKEYMAMLRSALTSGRGFQREIKTTIFGGKCYFLLSIEPFLDQDGQPAGLIGAGLDITAQRQLEQENREAIRQLEQQRMIIESREKERQEIAREIHDGPIQTLVSMMFDIQLNRVNFEQAGVPEEIQQELAKINAHMKGAVRELRDVVNNLRPPALLRSGVGKTLRAYIEDFQEKHPELDLEVLFDLPDDKIYFSEEISLSIYRLCQEGLNNIIRHAQASKAVIRFTRKGKKLILEIKDNGKGFKVPKDLSRKAREGHYGLAGMNERAGALGGVLRIYSAPQTGTRVRVIIPLEQPEL